MKIIARTISLIFICLLSSSAYADASQRTKKIAYLLKNTKEIIWDTDNILKGDVAWDSKTDFIVSGRTNTEVVLAIVNGANTKKYHIIKFDNVESFCVPAEVKISVGSSSASPDGTHIKNYYTTYKKLSVGVGDDSCDPNIITWNKKKKYFELFRN
jgi:hypothetical protein